MKIIDNPDIQGGKAAIISYEDVMKAYPNLSPSALFLEEGEHIGLALSGTLSPEWEIRKWISSHVSELFLH